MGLKDCTECIMEHSDGLVLIEPTIYVIEGDFYGYGLIPIKESISGRRKAEVDDSDIPF